MNGSFHLMTRWRMCLLSVMSREWMALSKEISIKATLLRIPDFPIPPRSRILAFWSCCCLVTEAAPLELIAFDGPARLGHSLDCPWWFFCPTYIVVDAN